MKQLTIKERLDRLCERYNADYLMTVMGAWQQHYNRAAFIDMGIGDSKNIEEEAKKEAAQRGWTYERISGDYRIIKMILDGNWGGDCLVLEPGEQIEMTYDDNIITNAPISSQKK